MSTANYIISSALYDDAFSANRNYPDYSRLKLETQSVFTSTAYEHELSGYTLDPDIQRRDVNGNTCNINSLLHAPTNGVVGTYWAYEFDKAWMYNGVTAGIDFEPSVLPNYGWITWIDNVTHFKFSGISDSNAHAVEYELTIVVKLQSDGSQVDTFTRNFTIQPNQPPTIGNMMNISINVPLKLSWGNGNNVIQDLDGDPLTITLEVDGLSVDWISISTTTYSFTALAKKENVGDHNVTVIVSDMYNIAVNTSFTLTVNLGNSPYSNGKYIANIETGINEYVSVEFLPVDDLFTDPLNVPMTASLILTNSDPLPSFFSFNPTNNTMYGTPTSSDVNDWFIAYVATNDNGYSGSITFTLSVKP